jgi:hypothetical protein
MGTRSNRVEVGPILGAGLSCNMSVLIDRVLIKTPERVSLRREQSHFW